MKYAALALTLSLIGFQNQTQEVAAPAGPVSSVKVDQAPPTKADKKIAQKPATTPAAPQKKPTKTPAPTPPKPPKSGWEEFPLDPKATLFLDFNEATPNSVISIFSRASGITILKDPQFKSPLTITTAKAVPLKKAFEIFNSVLNYYGYEVHKKGDLLAVEKIPPPPPPPGPFAPPPDMSPVPKVYRLANAGAVQTAKNLNDVFGAGGGQQPGGFPGGGGGAPGGAFKASPDEYGNAVIVVAPPQMQPKVESLLKEIDVPVENALDSRVFALTHISAEDAVAAIKAVLTAQTPLGKGQRQDSNNNPFVFRFFGGGDDGPQKGAQSAIAVKQTNSVIVTATKTNMTLIENLLKNVDKETEFVGSSTYIKLQNAKATDVADLLNKAFAEQQRNNDGGFFFFDFFDPNRDKKNNVTSDVVDGKVVNIRDLQGKVRVTADPNTNGLLINTAPSNLKYVKQVIEQLDQVADQVLIETIIVEATLDKTSKLGTEWNFLQNKVLGNPDVSSTGKTDFGIKSATKPNPGFSYTLSGADFSMLVNALQKDDKFKVLSTPRIFASNNVKSEFNVSQKTPYITSEQTTSTGGTISNYQFEDVGVVLTVTPRVASSGSVVMDIVQTASEFQGYTDFKAPLINKRSASTTVNVKDGETVVLGGIIRQTRTSSISKVPLLGDIPLVGELFKSSSISDGQTELMVFLTPHIVRSVKDARDIVEKSTSDLTKASQKTVKQHLPEPKSP